MAQSAVNWRNTHSRGSHAFTHTYINTVTTTSQCKALAHLLHKLEYIKKIEGTWGRGSKPEYPKKTPDNLPANRYHILEEKIQCLGQESNPHPPALVISSLGRERAPRLAHWATDRRMKTTRLIVIHVNMKFILPLCNRTKSAFAELQFTENIIYCIQHELNTKSCSPHNNI